jgi:hypothetical protein
MGLITADDFPSLTELYIARLRYLLSTENQIIKALPKMIEHADDTQLKQAFQSHRQETEIHVTAFRTSSPTSIKMSIIRRTLSSPRSLVLARTSPRSLNWVLCAMQD